MSIPVRLAALAERVDEFGPVAHLVTVSADAVPHVVAVRPEWQDDTLVVRAGRRTRANVGSHPEVTLVWAAPAGGDYSLIVDGRAAGQPDASAPTIAIRPSSAVLHRLPSGDELTSLPPSNP